MCEQEDVRWLVGKQEGELWLFMSWATKIIIFMAFVD